MSALTNIKGSPDSLISPVVELRDNLLAEMPELIQRIVLYGSHARGEARSDSDIDILVVLKKSDPITSNKIRAARYAVMEKNQYQPLISLLILSDSDWKKLSQNSAGLKYNIDQEGITLWTQT